MSFEDFPWFKDASVAAIFNVEEPSPNHFYWPDLDIDLGARTLEDPRWFPLVSKVARQSATVGDARPPSGPLRHRAHALDRCGAVDIAVVVAQSFVAL